MTEKKEYAKAIISMPGCEFHDVIDSTNIRAKELARAGAAEYSCVFADEQTRGRGRMDRHWLSEAGRGIYMTMIVRPKDTPASQSPIYSMGASLAVCDTLSGFGLSPSIKWPNDVLLDGRKLCGILSEAGLCADGFIDYIAVGIGINVSGTRFEGLPWACSVESVTEKQPPARGEIAVSLVQNLKKIFGAIKNNRRRRILDLVSQRMVTLGKPILAERDGDAVRGTAMKLLDDCSLLMETDEGKELVLIYGEVSVRGIMGYSPK
ncbi:MAG: biotin--[acetyl-CoA-carboxylase] ligase [Clostridia bacterium]|nr:biotin--[acetyl-CoA-carboxylase] ligase [Clostridia bacterium]